MDIQIAQFRKEVEALAASWTRSGLPSREALEAAAGELQRQKKTAGGKGLWEVAPLMITATLDDGLGQGLMIIHQFAEAVGVRIRPLGLMQTPEHIITVCKDEAPDFLGLTILQFDTEEDLTVIAHGVPEKTLLICGGPVFNADPDFAERCGVHFAAKHVGRFLEILLNLSRSPKGAGQK